MMNIQEIQEELLQLEYPFLSVDHDPDIERYFYLRNSHRPQDALVIYQNKLKPRYPDDDFRAVLMRCYRSRSTAYRIFLARAYRDLGERLLARVKRTIVYIVEKVESYNEKDVFSTIKAADAILLVMPKEHYEAQAGMERLLHYAEELDFHVESMAKAVELIRAYLNQSLSVVEEAINRRENQRRQELEREWQRKIREDWKNYSRQKKQKHRVARPRPIIDLTSIEFSEEELARIEIPGDIIKPEDQTLAYCFKYWNLIDDSAFEQILYFYSKKYGTKHHAVYLAIRRGRVNKFRDDEILASVMSVLVTGYYYSIRGDIYLQRKWNSIKSALQQHPSKQEAPRNRPKTTAPRMVLRSARSRRIGRPRSAGASQVSPGVSPPSASRQKPRKSFHAAAPQPSGSAGKVRRVQAASTLSRSKRITPVLIRAKPRIKALPIQAAPSPAETPVRVKAPLPPARAKAASAEAVPRVRAKAASASARPPARAKAVSAEAVPRVRAKAASAPAGTPARVKAASAEAAPRVRAKAASAPARPPARAKAASAEAAPRVRAKAVPAEKPAALQTPAKAQVPVQGEKTILPAVRQIRRLSDQPRKSGGSVSDRLRELSGRSYDVYQDRFLSRARGAIRKVMGSGKRLFFTLPGAVEDLVYNFLRDHYSDPYMNWEESQEKKDLEELGFMLDSLIPIIDECYHRL